MMEGLANFRLPNRRKSDAKQMRPTSSVNARSSTLNSAPGIRTGCEWIAIDRHSRMNSYDLAYSPGGPISNRIWDVGHINVGLPLQHLDRDVESSWVHLSPPGTQG